MSMDQRRKMKHERSRTFAHVSLLFLSYLCLSIFACDFLSAQEVDPNSLFGRDTIQSVFVRDSAVAVERFALAQRMEHLKEWDKAADVYQNILKSFPDRVVPSQLKDNKIYQYTSVIPAVQERLAKWPKEGLDVYRGRFEGEAAGILDAAHDDVEQLHRVFSIYFITDAARKASIRLIDLYMERGEFAAAAWLGDRLLALHPALNEDEPNIVFRTAMAQQLAGNGEQAQLRLRQLKEKFPQASAIVRGNQVVLAETLGQLLNSTDGKLHETAADSWPMAFGSPDRARVPQFNSFGGARLFGVELKPLPIRTITSPQKKALEDRYKEDVGSGLMTGIFPVVDRGELFFQDNARICAIGLESGKPLPGWAESYDGERDGRYILPNAMPFPRSQQCTITVTDDSVLAIMGMPDLVVMSTLSSYGRHDTKLVCLDRKNGRQKWVIDPKQLPDEAAALRTLDLTGSPLVVGDVVYTQMRGGKGAQFEDSYVIALELQSGKFKWACYVASANSPPKFWDNPNIGAVFDQNISHLAYASGRLYALTNLGAIASIDAYDGTVIWLDIYNRRPQDMMTGRAFGRRGGGLGRLQAPINSQATVKPWTSNPVMVSQGKVFVLPSDSDDLYIYDAGTGKEIKRISTNFYDSADIILGIVDEKLILSGDRQVTCLDWQKFDEKTLKKDDFLVWKYPRAFQSDPADDAISGRGLVTSDSVIIPKARQVVRISLTSGLILEQYPPGKTTSWSEDEGPGNVIMTQDRLIIAGPTASGQMRISGYTDLALAMRKRDAELAAAPNDPEPRLGYAEILFAAGKPDLALARLDDAIAIIVGKTSSGNIPPAVRQRAFNTALGFAEKLAKENREGSVAMVNGLFERAGVTANTAAQKVRYRLSRAAYASQIRHPDDEIKYYQQILLDQELRSAPVANADGDDVTPAGEVARTAIGNIIGTSRAFYAPYERDASDRLAAATAAGNVAQLQEVAALYPNSLAAPKALLAAADLYETSNNPRMAIQVLRQAYFRDLRTPETPRILETMARNYLRMPDRVDVAIARLRQAGDTPLLSKPLVLPDGSIIQNVSFAEAIASLSKFAARVTLPEPPDVKLPIPPTGAGVKKPDLFAPETPESIIAGVDGLIAPLTEYSRNDRVVTFSTGAGLQIFPVGATKPSITSNAVTMTPVGAAWIADNLLVWNKTELALIGAGGTAIWKTSLKSLPVLDVVTQNGEAKTQAAPPVEAIARQMQPQIQINGRGVVILPNGIVRFGAMNNVQLAAIEQVRPPTEEIDKLQILSDRIVFSTTDGRVMVVGLDAGKLLWQTRVNDRMPNNLLASDDFVVTSIRDNNGTSAQVTVLDSFSGQVVLRENFGSDNGMPNVPINVALSPDGMLVYLLPNRIEGKDLYNIDDRSRPKFAVAVAGGDMNMPFINSSLPDHLQIFGNRILAVTTGSGGGTVWMYNLRTGAPIPFNKAAFLDQLDAASVQGRFIIRMAGSMIYIGTSRDVRRFDLERSAAYKDSLGTPTPQTLRDLIVTKGHILSMTEVPTNRVRTPNDPALPVQLNAYSRAQTASGESGRYEHSLRIGGTTGVISFQAVDGGIYYLSQSHELHFLRGTAVR